MKSVKLNVVNNRSYYLGVTYLFQLHHTSTNIFPLFQLFLIFFNYHHVGWCKYTFFPPLQI